MAATADPREVAIYNRLKLSREGTPYLEVGRELGLTVELDGDDVLVIDPRGVLMPMVELIRNKHEDQVRAALERECGRIGMYCHGGPLDGRRSGICEGSYKAFHISRGLWACYVARHGDNGRARYIGMATSQNHARRKFYAMCRGCGHTVGQCMCALPKISKTKEV